ncbi:MAG: hypothetical protein R3B09_12870 [Nannocystaceae bacterium]
MTRRSTPRSAALLVGLTWGLALGCGDDGSTSDGSAGTTTTTPSSASTTTAETATSAAESTSTAGTTDASEPCEPGDFPGPEVPVSCAACIIVGDEPGFCADGVLSPTCVDGVWRCTGDTIPRERCEHPGAPCELDPPDTDTTT